MKKIIIAFMLALIVSMLAVTVSATVAVSYDLEEVTITEGAAYKVVATLTDDEGDFRGWKNDIAFDFNMIKPVNKTSGAAIDIATYPTNKAALERYTCTYYDESEGDDVTATASWADVQWTVNADNTANLVYETYITPNSYPSDGYVVFSMTFMIADGYTIDDFTPNTFKIDYIAYPNGNYNYYGAADGSGKTNNIVVTNNVVPEAAVIKIPVLAGDKVYLADEVVEIAADGEYDVTDQVGKYVAVYTENGYAGTNANDEEMTVYQTTYYVDDTEAKEVHLNGVFESAYNTIRDRTPVFDKETNTTEDRNGIRFKFAHNPAGRDVAGHEIVEVGFIITAESQKVLNEYPDGYTLDAEMVSDGYAKFGKVFGDGRNTAMSSTDDDKWIMSATFYNIPITEAGVKTNIVSRPYYKVGDTYIYGEITKKSLRDAALAIKEAAGENYDTEYPEGTAFRDYIDEILYASGDLEVVEEIIIDVGGLYDALAALEAAA